MNRSMTLKCLAVLMCAANVFGAKPFMGQYKGTFYPDSKVTIPATATVVDEGQGDWRINIHAVSDDLALEGAHIEIMGREFGPQVNPERAPGGEEPVRAAFRTGEDREQVPPSRRQASQGSRDPAALHGGRQG
ncbi:MAG: hypothetical protein ACYSWO_09910 [Planctomycetota bacterium]